MTQRFFSEPFVGKVWSLASLMVAVLILCLAFIPVQAQESREILRLGRGTANALDWRPDGKVLVVGGGTGIWLYDENFETLAHFDGGSVYPVRWSPFGDRLAFADGTGVHIWSIAEDGKTGNAFLSLEAIDISSLNWSPDGQRIAVATYEDSISIWNTDNGELFTLPDATWEAAWSPDGKKIAAPGNDNYSMHIWDAESEEKLTSLSGIEDYLFWTSLTWSPDGTQLAGVSSLPASLHIWNADTSEIVNTPDISGDMYSYQQVMWTQSCKCIVVIGNTVTPPTSGDISIYDPQSWVETQRIFVGNIHEIDLHPQKLTLTGLTFDSIISEWDIDSGDILSQNMFHTLDVYGLSWSPDENKIATTRGSVLAIWSLTDRENGFVSQPLFSLDTRAGTYTTGEVKIYWTSADEFISLEETYDYSGNVLNSILKRDADSGEVEEVFVNALVSQCAYYISTNLDKIACSQDDGIHILSVSDGDELATLPVTDRRLFGWSPDDTQIATVSSINNNQFTIEMWDVTTGKLANSFSFLSEVQIISWSPDGSKMVIRTDTDMPDTTLILDAKTGEILQMFFQSWSVAWSADSRFIVVEANDIQSIVFWDSVTGKSIEVVGSPNALAWSPDGTMLALGMNDGTIRIWDVSELSSK